MCPNSFFITGGDLQNLLFAFAKTAATPAQEETAEMYGLPMSNINEAETFVNSNVESTRNLSSSELPPQTLQMLQEGLRNGTVKIVCCAARIGDNIYYGGMSHGMVSMLEAQKSPFNAYAIWSMVDKLGDLLTTGYMLDTPQGRMFLSKEQIKQLSNGETESEKLFIGTNGRERLKQIMQWKQEDGHDDWSPFFANTYRNILEIKTSEVYKLKNIFKSRRK